MVWREGGAVQPKVDQYMKKSRRGRYLPPIFIILLLTVALIKSTWANGESIWKLHPEIASITLNLKGNAIVVVIKNTSGSPKELWFLEQYMVVELYYVDDNGKLVPLNFDSNPRAHPEVISGGFTKPLTPEGETYSFALSAQNLSKIRNHPVVAKTIIFDRPSITKYYIATSPQVLN